MLCCTDHSCKTSCVQSSVSVSPREQGFCVKAMLCKTGSGLKVANGSGFKFRRKILKDTEKL